MEREKNESVFLRDREERIFKTVALEKPDRTPVVLEYSGFAARVTNTSMAEFLATPSKALKTMIEAFHIVGEADAINYGTYYPYNLAYLWMSKVKVPGVDLPDDGVCQVVESERMTLDDYDRILSLGWPEFFRDFMEKRIFDDVPPDRHPLAQAPVSVRAEWARYGVSVLSGGTISSPFEKLCGGRSLNSFFCDLIAIPDKVVEVMDHIMPHIVAPVCHLATSGNFPAVWIGGWRSASNMISPQMWERFVWPYFERAVHEVVASGLIAILHLDSNWDRALPHFRSLPRRKCVLSLDGETSLFKAKEILGDHMCLMGDVPAAMLSFGTSDEVYEYCTQLIRKLGPKGFILHSGCDIPTDAKLSNVQAMVSAATGR